jgi:ribosomal protein L11 methyltransferase
LVWLIEQGGARPNEPEKRASELVLAEIPSLAFGNGSHPTTRLCAGAVDLLSRQLTSGASARGAGQGPWSFLDVGTGTGILARIARARGAGLVVGTDIDPHAIEAANRNSGLDESTKGGELTVCMKMPDAWGARFDLVMANILEGPLRELAPALVRAMAPGATLLISGFTPLQLPSLRVAFEAAGARYVSDASLEGWALGVFQLTAV